MATAHGQESWILAYYWFAVLSKESFFPLAGKIPMLSPKFVSIKVSFVISNQIATEQRVITTQATLNKTWQL